MMLYPTLLLWEKGGGMPVGFTASSAMMDLLSDNPKLGHHYFGGHPVIAAACLAMKEITETSLMPSALDRLDHFWYIL
jgi:4-aminobutyrate aminotransferase-like enzyme